MWKIISEFKKFALRGNVVDLAVGFTVGVAFTTVVKSAVDDLIMPVVGLVIGRVEFSELFYLLKPGPESPPPYATLAEAQAAGAVTINYGLFINNVITFCIIALVMFGLIRLINRLEERFPGIKERLLQDGDVRPDIAVAVDGEIIFDLSDRLREDSEVHFVPPISGGL